MLVGAFRAVMQNSVRSTYSARAAYHPAKNIIELKARGPPQHVLGAATGFSAATVCRLRDV